MNPLHPVLERAIAICSNSSDLTTLIPHEVSTVWLCSTMKQGKYEPARTIVPGALAIHERTWT